MGDSFTRLLKPRLPAKQSAFLWGIRKAGKSTLLKQLYPQATIYDLLKSDDFYRLLDAPFLLREDVLAMQASELKQPIIIDEIQKIPKLLDEVHWLIENTGAHFILCGSSTRKLKRGAANLLGGRAWGFHLYPLCSAEVPDLDLLRAFNRGLIPSHYLSTNPGRSLKAYVQEYMREEIQAEGLVRNLPSFSRFLNIFAYSHGELTNYSNIARGCGIDAKTVKEYYQILIDTLMGYYVYPYSDANSRDTIRATPKFYLTDLGIANYLRQSSIKSLKGTEAGASFEHFILMELIAYRDYREQNYQISFWRNKNDLEVDFIINRAQVAIEVKISNKVAKEDLRGLIEFKRRYPCAQAIVVSLDPRKRKLTVGDIEILIYPYKEFLAGLWAGKILLC